MTEEKDIYQVAEDTCASKVSKDEQEQEQEQEQEKEKEKEGEKSKRKIYKLDDEVLANAAMRASRDLLIEYPRGKR